MAHFVVALTSLNVSSLQKTANEIFSFSYTIKEDEYIMDKKLGAVSAFFEISFLKKHN